MGKDIEIQKFIGKIHFAQKNQFAKNGKLCSLMLISFFCNVTKQQTFLCTAKCRHGLTMFNIRGVAHLQIQASSICMIWKLPIKSNDLIHRFCWKDTKFQKERCPLQQNLQMSIQDSTFLKMLSFLFTLVQVLLTILDSREN